MQSQTRNQVVVNADGKAQMAFTSRAKTGSTWEKIGTEVSNDLTPEQMCEAAGALWEVKKFPLFYTDPETGKYVEIKDQALIRTSDMTVFDTVSGPWKPYQNEEAFQFFGDFVAAGDMEMSSAGVLDGGKRVWALARLNNPIEIIQGDVIQPYILFSNPHYYGAAIDVRLCSIRVLSGASYVLPLRDATNVFKGNHASQFDPVRAKRALGVAEAVLARYAENARYLASRKLNREQMVDFLKKVFPASGAKGAEDKMSLSAERTLQQMDAMPGNNKGAGTWWQAVNAVSYYVDNVKGRGDQTRLDSAWYGQGSNEKVRAMKEALKQARQQ